MSSGTKKAGMLTVTLADSKWTIAVPDNEPFAYGRDKGPLPEGPLLIEPGTTYSLYWEKGYFKIRLIHNEWCLIMGYDEYAGKERHEIRF